MIGFGSRVSNLTGSAQGTVMQVFLGAVGPLASTSPQRSPSGFGLDVPVQEPVSATIDWLQVLWDDTPRPMLVNPAQVVEI